MLELKKHTEGRDPFFLPLEPTTAGSGLQASELETELALLRARSATKSTRATSESSTSSNSSNSAGSSSSRSKFQHYHEPTILDRPEAVDAAKSALVKGDRAELARVASTYGLPPMLRSEAWPLLLREHPYVVGRRPPACLVPDNELPLRRVRGDVRRFSQMRDVSALNETAVFTALVSFLRVWGSEIPYETPMAWIAMYFAMGDFDGDEGSVEFTGVTTEKLDSVFANAMLVLTHEPALFGDFIGELRASLPDLAKHFATEGILSGNLGGDGWLVWWLKWYGIRALPCSVMARLWDVYFAMMPGALPMARRHIFNCLALMKEHRGKLLELDQSECRQFLAAAQPCNDVEAIISEASLIERASVS